MADSSFQFEDNVENYNYMKLNFPYFERYSFVQIHPLRFLDSSIRERSKKEKEKQKRTKAKIREKAGG